MSHPNYGKDFEKRIAEAMKRVAGVDVQRLYDTTNGFSGIKQPADYIVYRYPNQYYIECKCTWENTLHKDYIPQLPALFEKSKTKGIISGVIVWFIKHNYTCFIDAYDLHEHFLSHASINIKDVFPHIDRTDTLRNVAICGDKKRVFFGYDMRSFFDYFSYISPTDKV